MKRNWLIWGVVKSIVPDADVRFIVWANPLEGVLEEEVQIVEKEKSCGWMPS